MKKILAVLMSMVMIACAVPMAAIAESVVDRNAAPITLNVYSQLANYQGIAPDTTWGATVLLDKFNVRLNIIPDSDGTYYSL